MSFALFRAGDPRALEWARRGGCALRPREGVGPAPGVPWAVPQAYPRGRGMAGEVLCGDGYRLKAVLTAMNAWRAVPVRIAGGVWAGVLMGKPLVRALARCATGPASECRLPHPSAARAKLWADLAGKRPGAVLGSRVPAEWCGLTAPCRVYRPKYHWRAWYATLPGGAPVYEYATIGLPLVRAVIRAVEADGSFDVGSVAVWPDRARPVAVCFRTLRDAWRGLGAWCPEPFGGPGPGLAGRVHQWCWSDPKAV